jgi:integrase
MPPNTGDQDQHTEAPFRGGRLQAACARGDQPLEAVSGQEEPNLCLAAPRPAESDPAAIYLAQLKPGSLPSTRAALDTMAAMLTEGGCDASRLDWSALRAPQTRKLQAELAARYSPATVGRMVACLRRTLKEAWRLGLIDSASYQEAIDLPPARRVTPAQRASLTPDDLRALLAACQADPTPFGTRDAALLTVLSRTGLRCGELLALEVSHFDPERGALVVGAGKGPQERVVHLADEALSALTAWIALRGSEAGPLFLPILGGGRMASHGLHRVSVLDILRKRATEAAITRFSPQDLRRLFIRQLLDEGIDSRLVQGLAGHVDVRNTRGYGRSDPAVEPAAAKRPEGQVYYICGRCGEWLPIQPERPPHEIMVKLARNSHAGADAETIEYRLLCNSCWVALSEPPTA